MNQEEGSYQLARIYMYDNVLFITATCSSKQPLLGRRQSLLNHQQTSQ